MVDPEHPNWKVSEQLRANARALRHDSTDAERILWSERRNHRLNGAGFRRQVPIENFIADFVCHDVKLVIELDGGQHFSDEGERADIARSAVIEAKGFKVLRFSNHDVMTNRTGVLETIATAVAERAPTPTLPRKRRGIAYDQKFGKPDRERDRCSRSGSASLPIRFRREQLSKVICDCPARKRGREQIVPAEKKQP